MNTPQYTTNPPPFHQYHQPLPSPSNTPTETTLLRLKDLEIQTLLREIESLRAIHKSPRQKIPLSIDFLIRNLKIKTKAQEDEIRRLRESLQHGDPLNRHIYEKMKDVIEENRELEKMVSAGRVDQLSVDISLLKRENELCRERIEEYKRVLFQMDEDLEKVISIVKEYQSRYGELEGVI